MATRSAFTQAELEQMWLELLRNVVSRDNPTVLHPHKILQDYFVRITGKLPVYRWLTAVLQWMEEERWLTRPLSGLARIELCVEIPPEYLVDQIDAILDAKDAEVQTLQRERTIAPAQSVEPAAALVRSGSSVTDREWIVIYRQAVLAMFKHSFCKALDGYVSRDSALSTMKLVLRRRNIEASDDLAAKACRELEERGVCEAEDIDGQTFFWLEPALLPVLSDKDKKSIQHDDGDDDEALVEGHFPWFNLEESLSTRYALEGKKCRELPAWHPWMDWKGEVFIPREVPAAFTPVSVVVATPVVDSRPEPIYELVPVDFE